MQEIQSFKIIGIEVQTTNEKGKGAEDIGALWGKFFSENIAGKIPNKVSEEIYAIYTDYESDFTGKYTTVIGQKVTTFSSIPEGCVGREFQAGNYQKFLAKGAMPNAIVEVWKEIWKNDKNLKRKYTADFEVYGEKSQQGDNSEVAIYIALK
jgi:predicted transcriptional regulator YdeE